MLNVYNIKINTLNKFKRNIYIKLNNNINIICYLS